MWMLVKAWQGTRETSLVECIPREREREMARLACWFNPQRQTPHLQHSPMYRQSHKHTHCVKVYTLKPSSTQFNPVQDSPVRASWEHCGFCERKAMNHEQRNFWIPPSPPSLPPFPSLPDCCWSHILLGVFGLRGAVKSLGLLSGPFVPSGDFT